MILACNRHQALILPVRLAGQDDDEDYLAGTVLGKNTTSGYFEAYDDNASSGLNTAKAILLHDVSCLEGETQIAKAIFGGLVWKDKLVGLDSNGISDLGARTITDSSGLGDILKF